MEMRSSRSSPVLSNFFELARYDVKRGCDLCVVGGLFGEIGRAFFGGMVGEGI
jgi:hypothetical protein